MFVWLFVSGQPGGNEEQSLFPEHSIHFMSHIAGDGYDIHWQWIKCMTQV